MIRTERPHQQTPTPLEGFASTRGQAVGAAGSEAWAMGFQSFERMVEEERFAQAGRLNPRQERAMGLGQDEAFALEQQRAEDQLGALMSVEEMEEEYGHLGLTFDRPLRQEVALALAERRSAQIQRQNIMARADRAGSGALMLAAGLGTSLVDPVNIVTSFVPIVGQARFARMAARVGLTQARIARGGIEGFAGAALVEPFILRQADRDQLDYDMADSLMNLTFGTVAGGAIHPVGGLIADRFRSFQGQPTQAERLAVMAQVEEITRGWDALSPAQRAQRFQEVASALVRDEGIGRRTIERIARENRQVAAAYDQVRSNPVGPADDPTVILQGIDLEAVGRGIIDVALRRGGNAVVDGELQVRGKAVEASGEPRSGDGLVKIIFRHGEESQKDPRLQVTRDDVLAIPAILRTVSPQAEGRSANFAVGREDHDFVVGVSRTRSRDLVVTAFRRPHDGDFSGGGGGSRINAPRASRLTDTGSDLSVLGSERPPPTSAEQTGSPSTRHSATPLRDTGPAASSIASERPVRSDNIADSDAPVYGTDPEASNEVARTISERGTDEAMRLADELAEVNERLATLRQADSISPREQEIMAEADIKAQNLEQTAALYRAASICLTGGT